MKPLDFPAALARLLPPVPDDGPFLARVAQLAACRGIVARRDLLDEHGRVLLACGERAEGDVAALIAGLAADPLAGEAFAFCDGPGGSAGDALAAEAEAALGGHALLACLVDAAGGAASVAAPLAKLALPPALELHVEMARVLAPRLHRHGLRSALSCVALGRLGGGGTAEEPALATIGLLHDIGVLHADEAVLQEQPLLSPAQRAQFVNHGDVSARLLRRYLPQHAALAQAVAAHHERLDGSGWPRRLSGNDVSPWARVVALAELLTTFETDGGILDALRVSNLLRLQAGAFDARLAGVVLAACDALERG